MLLSLIMSHLLLELGPFLLKETSSFLSYRMKNDLAYSLARRFVICFGL
jgi:hypothetical protein